MNGNKDLIELEAKYKQKQEEDLKEILKQPNWYPLYLQKLAEE